VDVSPTIAARPPFVAEGPDDAVVVFPAVTGAEAAVESVDSFVF